MMERSPTSIRLLMVEDVVPEAELIVSHLKSEGIECQWQRVETEGELRDALKQTPDLIISDCNLPAFDGLAALEIAAIEAPAVPFIFVSGTLGETRALEAMQAGALAWIRKDDRTALGATVRRALAGTPQRRRADAKPAEVAAIDTDLAAQHLLERRALLDETLQPDHSDVTHVLRRHPPEPFALLMISAPASLERFEKVLTGARIDLEIAADVESARSTVQRRIPALLFTDSLELVQVTRQLLTGAATHIVYIYAGGEEDYSSALRAGANDCLPAQARGEIFWAHLTIAKRIFDFAASLQAALTDNRLLATIDELTRIGSRRYFEHEFPREVERAARLARPLALVICDIDHFKQINDQYGHPAGDEVLREFAARLSRSLRIEDWMARTGGEEFAIVVPDATAIVARRIAKRLCQVVNSEPFATTVQSIPVTASFGVCALPRIPRAFQGWADAMVKDADRALYESKDRGRNCVTVALLGAEERAPEPATTQH